MRDDTKNGCVGDYPATKIHGECLNAEKANTGKLRKGVSCFDLLFFFLAVFCIVCQLAFYTHIIIMPDPSSPRRLTNARDGIVSN